MIPPGRHLNWQCNEADAVGFVLAGGQSTRMGRDKALVEFGGRPLLLHAIAALRAAGLPVFIAGARTPLDAYAPVVPDSRQNAGPPGGICTALESIRHTLPPNMAQYAVFLSVDQPLMPPSLLVYLLYHARMTGSAVTLPSVNGFAQTFPVVLTVDSLAVLETELSSGRTGSYAAFQAAAAARGEAVSVLRVEVLVQSGKIAHPAALPAAHWFLNINAPPDLSRASSIAAGRVS